MIFHRKIIVNTQSIKLIVFQTLKAGNTLIWYKYAYIIWPIVITSFELCNVYELL